MPPQNRFTSLNQRRRYYADLKFNTQSKEFKTKPHTREQSFNEIKTLKTISEVTENVYRRDSESELTKIPYFTNNVESVNVFKENKNTTGNDDDITLNVILEKMIISILHFNGYECEHLDLDTILLHIQYPIEREHEPNQSFICFDSTIIESEQYTTVKISDVILYAMIKDRGVNFISVTNNSDIFIMGSDILKENYVFSRNEFDSYFITLAKTIFATTLIGRNLDQLGLMDYPSYQFSVGTYSLNMERSSKFKRALVSHTLVHVLPFWEYLFNSSFLIELATTNVSFNYQRDTLFLHYERDIDINCFHQVSSRTENIMTIPLNVSISNLDSDIPPMSVYDNNVKIRNKLSHKLNGVKNFHKVKDKMFPKDKQGAKTKLQQCLLNLEIQKYDSVLDIGSAPGTWIDHLMTIPTFSTVHGITTEPTSVHLKMYDDIIQRIKSDDRATLHYGQAVEYLKTSQSYSLIVSDMATKRVDYINQSIDHDSLFVPLINSIMDKLVEGGAFIMKMYDLTHTMSDMLEKIKNNFSHIKLIKPTSSCPTNPEMYIIATDYHRQLIASDVMCTSYANDILLSQICNLNGLLTQGFGLQVEHSLHYINNRLRLSNIEYVPYHLLLCLSQMKFSEYLYPTHLTGTMFDEVTVLGDRFLRINWDIPKFPYINVRYVTQTSIGYESNGVGLQELLIMHHGMILEDGMMKTFFIVDKDASCLFSDDHVVTCITSAYSQRLPENQFTISDLMTTQKYLNLFAGVTTFPRLEYLIKQVSLSRFVDLQQYYNTISSTTILNQFFRECETMRLFYTKSKLYSSIRLSKTKKPKITLNLSNHNDRKTFVEKYRSNRDMGKNLRQTFFDLLNEYSFQIWNGELLTSTICTTKRSYREYKTGQICISQPACNQFRRQHHFHSI